MKRKFFTLLLSVFLCNMAMAQDPEAVIKRAPEAPVIDGMMDGIWLGANSYNIAVPLAGEEATLGDLGTTTWRGLWTDEGVYILLKVNDDVWYPSYVTGGNSWEHDKPELYFDANAEKKDGLGPQTDGNGGGNGHYQVAPAAEEAKIDGTPTTQADGVVYSFLVTGGTYMAEYFIPFAKLKDGTGADLDLTAPVGFDVTIIDRDDVTPGRLRHNWSNDGSINESWANMDGCGTFTLSDEEAVGGSLIMKAEAAPVIDGEIDAMWENAPANSIVVPFKEEAATVGDAGETTWKALWTADGMYFLIEVADDQWFPFWAEGGGANGWEYDKIELYFDTNVPRKDGVGGQGSSPGTVQIAPDSKTDGVDGTMLTGQAFGIDYNYAIKVTDPKYVAEYFIPWDIVNTKEGIAFDKATEMGFDVTVIDRDPGDAARKRVNWANAGALDENWNNMDDAGVVKFDGVTEVIYVDAVTISGGTAITTDNGTLQLVATVEPADASNQKVKWTAQNGTGRATIDSKGLLTGVVNGEVTVIAEATDGGFASKSVKVMISGQTVLKRELSYVKNGFFEQVTATGGPVDWSAGTVVEGELILDPAPGGVNYWDYTSVQVVAVAMEDKDKAFTLSFRAWSETPSTSAADEFDIDFEDSNNGYSRYGVSTHPYATQGGTSDWNFLITGEPVMYVFDVTFTNMAENCRQALQFMVGRNDGPLHIDSVMLIKDEDLSLIGTSARSLANAKSKVQLYPNPVQNELTISKIATANSKVSVYNAVGQKLIEKTANGNQAKFDVSNLRKGMYFVRFSDGSSEKFLKQ